MFRKKKFCSVRKKNYLCTVNSEEMKKISIILASLFLMNCSEKLEKNTMLVSGEVKGLKKGTIFLQKIDENGKFKTIDSVIADGDGKFLFKTPLKSPEIFSLFLKREEDYDLKNRLFFFGEPTKITIETPNETFDTNAEISGSETQKLLEEYNQVMRKFGQRNTEYLAAQLEASKLKDPQKTDSILQLANQNQIRQILFSVNYALSHKNSHIAPYIALNQGYALTTKYLDSIYNSLDKKIVQGKYGTELKKFITKLKRENRILEE